MINLKIRTEYSIGTAYGFFDDVFNSQKTNGVLAMTDRNNTFGHWKLQKKCIAENIKPIFGVELAIYESLTDAKFKKQRSPDNWVTVIAKNDSGLKEVYELMTEATENKYYIFRLSYDDLNNVSDNVYVLSGQNPKFELMDNIENLYVEVNPVTRQSVIDEAVKLNLPLIATSDNFYLSNEQENVYEVALGRNANVETHAQFLLNESSWNAATCHLIFDHAQAISNTYSIADSCNAKIHMAKNVKPKVDKTLIELCEIGAKKKNIDLTDKTYNERLYYELKMIREKGFEDYFLMVSDLIDYAKSEMIVGAGRGSSAGSLVCYLTNITEINPIEHNLMFERFMSPDRYDPPDVDTDFEDNKRDLVHLYLERKYGIDCVAGIGTVNQFKPKSALIDAIKVLGIPLNAINEFKDSVIERSAGDERATKCLYDSLHHTNRGKELLKKFPTLDIVCNLEGHTRHVGKHAAGIVVTDSPLTNYCAIDKSTGAVMMDKYDVEECGMLKLDALGLRTLTIVGDILKQIDKDMDWLLTKPLNDVRVFDELNNKRFDGIFQWEGDALKGLTSQVVVDDFSDFVAITSLARPASLASGGAQQWVDRKNGEEVAYVSQKLKPFIEETKGVLTYQEQVLQACREIGHMEWSDISGLRKAIGKSKGRQFIQSNYGEKFINGAVKNGLPKNEAAAIFDYFVTFGEYGFNKSHAVSYALLSYQTAFLKAYYPLEFYVATLRNAKDEQQTVAILRQLVKDGYEYSSYDKELSGLDWAVIDGKVIGGLTNIKGLGITKARSILQKRKMDKPLLPNESKLLLNGITPFDDVFERNTLWSHVIENPSEYNIVSKISDLEEIDGTSQGTFLILAKIAESNLTDMNDSVRVERRGNKVKGNSIALSLLLEDDTGHIKAMINRTKYHTIGKKFESECIDGDYCLFKGEVSGGFRFLHIDRYVKLTGVSKYER